VGVPKGDISLMGGPSFEREKIGCGFVRVVLLRGSKLGHEKSTKEARLKVVWSVTGASNLWNVPGGGKKNATRISKLPTKTLRGERTGEGVLKKKPKKLLEGKKKQS